MSGKFFVTFQMFPFYNIQADADITTESVFCIIDAIGIYYNFNYGQN